MTNDTTGSHWIEWEGPIAIEGTPTADGRVILEGALTWETPLPVTVRDPGDFTQHAIGVTTSISRGEHGTIRASGMLERSALNLPQMEEAGILDPSQAMAGVGVTLASVTFRDDGALLEVLQGNIQAVAFTSFPAWDDARVQLQELPTQP